MSKVVVMDHPLIEQKTGLLSADDSNLLLD